MGSKKGPKYENDWDLVKYRITDEKLLKKFEEKFYEACKENIFGGLDKAENLFKGGVTEMIVVIRVIISLGDNDDSIDTDETVEYATTYKNEDHTDFYEMDVSTKDYANLRGPLNRAVKSIGGTRAMECLGSIRSDKRLSDEG